MPSKSRAGAGHCMLCWWFCCVDRQNYIVIMSTERCISVVNETRKGEGELFTSRLTLTDYRLMRAGCDDFFLCVL